ncbi:MAG: hypothetical protein IJ619_06925 [Eubacterium sp.]|nr:hypothetical protein [Eubacterium sp.]
MISFDEEIKNYKPSILIDDTEDAIFNNDLKDITDIVLEMTQDLRGRS